MILIRGRSSHQKPQQVKLVLMEGGQPLEMPNRMLRGLRGSDRSYQSSAIGGLEQEREGVWYSLTVLTKRREREKGKEVWCCWELVKMLLESCASTVSITGVQVVCGVGKGKF